MVCFNASRLHEWPKRQTAQQINSHVQNKGTPPPEVWFLPLVWMALLRFRVGVVRSLEDHHLEVLAIRRESGFHGLVAYDSEYALSNIPYFLSAHALKLSCNSQSLTTSQYLVHEVSRQLDLDPKRFIIFVSLLWNRILPEEDLAAFHWNLLGPEHPLAFLKVRAHQLVLPPCHVVIKAVAENACNIPDISNLEAVAKDIFRFSQNRSTMTGLEWLLLMTVVRFLKAIEYYITASQAADFSSQIGGLLSVRPEDTVVSVAGQSTAMASLLLQPEVQQHTELPVNGVYPGSAAMQRRPSLTPPLRQRMMMNKKTTKTNQYVAAVLETGLLMFLIPVWWLVFLLGSARFLIGLFVPDPSVSELNRAQVHLGQRIRESAKQSQGIASGLLYHVLTAANIIRLDVPSDQMPKWVWCVLGLTCERDGEERWQKAGRCDNTTEEELEDQPTADLCWPSASSLAGGALRLNTQIPSLFSMATRNHVDITVAVAPEVLRVAQYNHRRDLMYPYICHGLTKGEMKLSVSIEHKANSNLPLAVQLFWPICRYVYGVLFSLAEARRNSGRLAVRKNRLPEYSHVLVKEWAAYKVKSPHPELVGLSFREWRCPNLKTLWLGKVVEDKKCRMIFLACMRSDTLAMLNPNSVPTPLLVLCCVLWFMLHPGMKIFLPHAVSPKLDEPDQLQDLKLDKLDPCGVQLAALFMSRVDMALFVNNACGQPVPWEHCCPWMDFDGKLLESKLLRAQLIDPCDGQRKPASKPAHTHEDGRVKVKQRDKTTSEEQKARPAPWVSSANENGVEDRDGEQHVVLIQPESASSCNLETCYTHPALNAPHGEEGLQGAVLFKEE
ncbi:LOW QUALITY PROTEIN: constitutive coactivator of PPAR-gamma-like protein 1 [Anableps anableps]